MLRSFSQPRRLGRLATVSATTIQPCVGRRHITLSSVHQRTVRATVPFDPRLRHANIFPSRSLLPQARFSSSDTYSLTAYGFTFDFQAREVVSVDETEKLAVTLNECEAAYRRLTQEDYNDRIRYKDEFPEYYNKACDKLGDLAQTLVSRHRLDEKEFGSTIDAFKDLEKLVTMRVNKATQQSSDYERFRSYGEVLRPRCQAANEYLEKEIKLQDDIERGSWGNMPTLSSRMRKYKEDAEILRNQIKEMRSKKGWNEFLDGFSNGFKKVFWPSTDLTKLPRAEAVQTMINSLETRVSQLEAGIQRAKDTLNGGPTIREKASNERRRLAQIQRTFAMWYGKRPPIMYSLPEYMRNHQVRVQAASNFQNPTLATLMSQLRLLEQTDRRTDTPSGVNAVAKKMVEIASIIKSDGIKNEANVDTRRALENVSSLRDLPDKYLDADAEDDIFGRASGGGGKTLRELLEEFRKM